MVNSEGQIKRYSRVAWIDDKGSSHKRHRTHSPPPPDKRQQLISFSANLSLEQPVEFSLQAPDGDLEESNKENDVPQDFLFEFTSNVNDPTPSEPKTSPPHSLRTTPDIPNATPKSSNFSISQKRPITRSQKTSNTELLSLLASANSPEIPEPKNYKQATSKQNPHHDDREAAMQDEIDSLISNDIWILTQLLLGLLLLMVNESIKLNRSLKETFYDKKPVGL